MRYSQGTCASGKSVMRPIPNLPETTHTVKTRRFSELFELVIIGLIWATEREKMNPKSY